MVITGSERRTNIQADTKGTIFLTNNLKYQMKIHMVSMLVYAGTFFRGHFVILDNLILGLNFYYY